MAIHTSRTQRGAHSANGGVFGAISSSGGGATASGQPDDYEGPLDVVPGAVLALGNWAMSAATRGSPLYTIREDSGDTEQSFNSNAITGLAPEASIATFLGVNNGFISLWNNYGTDINIESLIQPVLELQPKWITDGTTTSVPCFSDSDGATFSQLSQVPMDTSFEAITIFAVSQIDSDASPAAGFFDADADAGDGMEFIVSTGEVLGFGCFDATVTNEVNVTTDPGACTLDAFHIFEVKGSSNATMEFRVDGVVKAITASAGNGVFGPIIALYPNTLIRRAADANTRLAALLIYDSVLSAADCLAVRQNIATRCGITLP